MPEPHWTDREAGETLADWFGRMAEQVDFPRLDRMVREAEAAGEPISATVETIYLLRVMIDSEATPS